MTLALLLLGCQHRSEGAPDTGDSPYPGTSGPAPFEDVYVFVSYLFDGNLSGHPLNYLELFTNVWLTPNPHNAVKPLLEQGDPIDDCTVYGAATDGLLPGPTIDAGELLITAGDRSYTQTYDEAYGYGYGAYGPLLNGEQAHADPPWGEEISASLEGGDDAPGFDYEPLTVFPKGPVLLSAPKPSSDKVLTREQATLRWNGLHDAPLYLTMDFDVSDPILNIECKVTDDGEFTIPDHVFDWVDSPKVVKVAVLAQRSTSRSVEVAPHKWLLFGANSQASTYFMVDVTR